jgi:predicted GIY-YIG superfamily endonuclease
MLLLLFMGFYVYVIQSEKDGSFYRGMTVDIAQRLCAHNEGRWGNTLGKAFWKFRKKQDGKYAP